MADDSYYLCEGKKKGRLNQTAFFYFYPSLDPFELDHFG